MPASLTQLQDRRDQCLEKIEQHRTLALESGGNEFGTISFNTTQFFQGLTEMRDQDIEKFLNIFPQLHQVMELCRQAAVEEKRRRKFQNDIDKKEKQQTVKMALVYKRHKKKEIKTKKRMKKLKDGDMDSSQELCDT